MWAVRRWIWEDGRTLDRVERMNGIVPPASPGRANGPSMATRQSSTLQGRSMTGLSVLYAREAAEEREWAAIPDRDRTGRLREVYWARRAVSKSGRKSFVSMNLNWWADRTEIGRRRDEPGDGFIYLVDMTPRVDEGFEWLEVTEVFTTVPASKIEGAMRAWNGIPDKHPVDFDQFRKDLRRGRPSRVEQRGAADQVIAQIETKLAKASYHELLEKYGYGTLVVGMPLWFAVPPGRPVPGGERGRRLYDANGSGVGGRQAKGAEKTGLPVQEGHGRMGHEPASVASMARGEVGRVRGCGQCEPGESHGGATVGGTLGFAGESGIENGDPGARCAVDAPEDPRGGTKEGVGQGPLPRIRRGVWQNRSRTRREAHGPQSNIEVEGRTDALQAALFRKNSRSGRVRTMDRAQVFHIVRLEIEGGTAKGEALLPRKQTKRPGFWWAVQSLRGWGAAKTARRAWRCGAWPWREGISLVINAMDLRINGTRR